MRRVVSFTNYFLLGLLLDSEDGANIFLRIVGISSNHMALYPCLINTAFLLGLFLNFEDGSNMYLRNVS
jgi:hypothetical protein